jgi:hypothetical protein
MPGLVPGIHVLLSLCYRKTWMAGTSPAMTSSSLRQRCRMIDQRLIALARQPLEAGTVQDFYDAARLGDDAFVLHLAGDLGHRGAPHAEHFGEQFLR